MTPKSVLDAVVSDLSRIDVRLSGEDSPLANPWEEVKEQLQHEQSDYWPAYIDTMRQMVAGCVADLATGDFNELCTSLKCSSREGAEKELLRRLFLRGKKERIKYTPFDFTYFCYPLLDFTAYGQVIERTTRYHCNAKVFSVAAPYGEHGVVDTSRIDSILSREQFETARTQGWPESWGVTDRGDR